MKIIIRLRVQDDNLDRMFILKWWLINRDYKVEFIVLVMFVHMLMQLVQS